MTALRLVVIIVCTAVEYTSVLGIHLNNQVSILTLGALANVMLMHLVIGHEIAHFCLVSTDPQI